MRRVIHTAFIFCVAAGCGAFTPQLTPTHNQWTQAQSNYLMGTDPDRAITNLKQLPSTPATDFLIGDGLDILGEPVQALKYYLGVLKWVKETGEYQDEAIAAAMAIVAMRDRIDSLQESLIPFLRTVAKSPGLLPYEATYQLNNLYFALLRKRGEATKLDAQLANIGCITTWKTVGPLGPETWERFDARGIEHSSAWSSSLIPFPGAPAVQSSIRKSKSCTVRASDTSFPSGGISYAQTHIGITEPTVLSFRLDTTNSAKLFIGNHPVIIKDNRHGFQSEITWVNVQLPKGTWPLTVKLAAPQGQAFFSLVVRDKDGHPLEPDKIAPNQIGFYSGRPQIIPFPSLQPHENYPAHAYSTLKKHLWWQDSDNALKILQRLIEEAPSSPILLLHIAQATMQDPYIPGEIAYERARGYLESALKKEPKLWSARIHLARQEAGVDSPLKAIRRLQEGYADTPKEPAVYYAAAQLAADNQWEKPLLEAVAALVQLTPNSCKTQKWQHRVARMQHRFQDASVFAREINKCDATSGLLVRSLADAGQLPEAAAAASKVADLLPEDALIKFSEAQWHIAADDLPNATTALRQALLLEPANVEIRSALGDVLVASGKTIEAKRVLEEGMILPAGSVPSLFKAFTALDSSPPFKEFRIDGDSLISKHIESSESVETPSQWVLDRMIHVVDPSGARMEIIHTISHVTTEEAITEQGEIAIPEGATVLTLRTVKKDGRKLYPPAIQNKPTISMPNIEKGDFIEVETINFHPPSQIYGGGFDTGRFYFQDFSTHFLRSEMILITPTRMKITLDPRGDCPKAQIVETNGYRIHTWRRRKVSPTKEEPYAPSPSEYLPSIRVTGMGDSTSACIHIRESLADKTQISPHMTQLVNTHIITPNDKTPTDKAKRIYQWTMNNIANTSERYDQVSHMVERKQGSRARVFDALLRAAQVDSELAIALSVHDDQTLSPVPDLYHMNREMVRIGDGTWISLDEDHTPFGYLPTELRGQPSTLINSCESENLSMGTVPQDNRHITGDITVHEDGSAIGRFRETISGKYGGAWRATFKALAKEEVFSVFQEEYIASTIPGALLHHLEHRELHSQEKPFELIYTLEFPRFIESNAVPNEQHIRLPFKTALLKQFGGLAHRTTPLVVATYIHQQTEITITIPQNLKVADSPRFSDVMADTSLKSEWGHISVRSTRTENRFTISRHLTIEAKRVYPDQYPSFLAFARETDDLSDISIKLISN